MEGKPVLKFKLALSDHNSLEFKFFSAQKDAPNWQISCGETTWVLKLSFAESLNWFKVSKEIWVSAVKALFANYLRYGIQLPPSEAKLLEQMYLNWFGPPDESTRWLICTKHSAQADSSRCSRCGHDDWQTLNSEEEEEEAEAELCDCGYMPEECECPECEFCGERQPLCECEMCKCGRCKCENKKHWRKHPAQDCDCAEPCPKKRQKKMHGILRCECQFCPGCEELMSECECDPDESSSGEYEY